STNLGRQAVATGGSGRVPEPAVAAQLAGARKVYLSNEARDRIGYDQEDNDLVCNKVRDALKAWGKYELAASATEADLVFDPSIDGMNLELAVINPKAGDRVWTFTQKAQKAVLYTNRQKNIGNAANALMDDLRKAESKGSAGMLPPEAQPR